MRPTATPTSSCSSPRAAARPTRATCFQQTPAVLNEAALLKFLDDKIRTLGTAACPPYHLAIVIGGTSAEMNLKTVKLASRRYLDDLPSEGNNKGLAFRDREMEKKVLELTRQMGIGAQFGGKYFCHDVRVIRMPATAPRCRSASASPARPTARPSARSPGTASSSSSSRPTRRSTCRRSSRSSSRATSSRSTSTRAWRTRCRC